MKLSILRAAILLLTPTAAFASVIPEPSEFALLSVGAAVAALVAWKRKAK
jgi:uncharacterized protein YccT (UPF0319 family)